MDRQDWFSIKDTREKIKQLPSALNEILTTNQIQNDFVLGRDVTIVAIPHMEKLKLSSNEGQARLLHGVANIELQAMELAVRTLSEFPEAPQEFREQLADIALGESRHLTLCLDGIDHLGFQWGNWTAHLSLWNAVDKTDSLLDRVLIVHRYFEGSGLDAGDSILRRLLGVDSKVARQAVEVIVREEVDHVLFGSRWYRTMTSSLNLDIEKDFSERIARIAKVVPRREQVARELRRQAGFTDFEIGELEKYQLSRKPQ